jgi:hypothetical protein
MTTVHQVLPDQGSGIPDALGSVLNEGPKSTSYVAFTKGAVDSLLEISNKDWTDGGQAESLDEGWRERRWVSDAWSRSMKSSSAI